MQSEQSQQIIDRFFDALHRLVELNIIRGVQTFTRAYDINRRNLYILDKNRASDIFQCAWLSYLTNDFKVSPRWLLTGAGSFFDEGWDVHQVSQFVKSKTPKQATDKQL